MPSIIASAIHGRGAALALAALLCLAGGFARAAGEAAPWVPPAPAADGGFDWVQLPSGEWLGGEIGVLYDESLEFESDQLGDLVIDWDDVVQLRSTRTLRVRSADQRTALGRVLLRDGQVRVVGENSGTFAKRDVLTIAPRVERRIDAWSVTVGAGANYRSGNTDQTDTNLRVSAQRRTVVQRMVLDYLSNFSETESETTTNDHRLNVNWDRFVNERLYWTPLFAEYYSDEFRNIAHRMTVGVGMGYQVIDTTKTSLRITAGPGYQKTWFEDVEPGEDESVESPAFVAETRFDHDLTDDIDLLYDYRFQITSEDNGRYNHHMEAGIAIELIGDLNLTATYAWDRVQEPQEDEDGEVPERDDFQLLLTLGYTF